MKGCVKGIEGEPYSVIINNRNYVKETIRLDTPIVLKKSNTYVFPLKEELYFKRKEKCKLHGRATGKSSIGRLDFFTRLIVDNSNV